MRYHEEQHLRVVKAEMKASEWIIKHGELQKRHDELQKRHDKARADLDALYVAINIAERLTPEQITALKSIGAPTVLRGDEFKCSVCRVSVKLDKIHGDWHQTLVALAATDYYRDALAHAEWHASLKTKNHE